ncbi:MAG: hypothetical protein U0269_02965 [Polyangiales bacterium]
MSRSVSRDSGVSLALLEEPRLAAPPASPQDCTLELPVRSVLVGDETVSFATAAAGARTALAISTRVASALFVTRGDQSILALEPPFEPASTVSAAGARDTFVFAWADRTAIERRSRPTFAVLDEREQLATFALEHQYALAMTEVLCERTSGTTRCGFGAGWREEFESTDDVRARFFAFAPSTAGASLTLEASPILQRTAPHSVLSTSPLRAHVRNGAATARYSIDGPLAPVSEASIEEAFVAGQLRSLVASAPSSERCQPNGWTLELSVPSGPSLRVATVDARPRGARVRATGADGQSPIVFWLDEPQCAERAHVVRATHAGQSVVLASASEYDAASDRALVSLAWRDAERVRWARYRCPR